MPRNRIMNINISEPDLKFLVSSLKSLDRILDKGEQDEVLVDRLFKLRKITALLERSLLKQ